MSQGHIWLGLAVCAALLSAGGCNTSRKGCCNAGSVSAASPCCPAPQPPCCNQGAPTQAYSFGAAPAH